MKRVLVVGGGLAGLSAAVGLADAGFRVEVLEGSASPGGRVRRLKHGAAIDRGQHLMLGCYRESVALIDRLGTAKQLREVRGTTPFLSGPGRVHPYRLGRLPAPLHALPGLTGLTQLDWQARLSLVRAVAAAKLQVRLRPGSLDGISADRWLAKHGQGEGAMRGFWEPLILAALNLPPKDASALLLATVIDRGFFAKRTDAVPLLPQRTLHDLFVAPAVSEITRLGGRVRCRQKARRLELNADDTAVAAVITQSGERCESDQFVLAVPPWDVPDLLGETSGLGWVVDCAERLSFSPILGVELWFDRAWMRYPYAALLDSPVQWIFNHQEELHGAAGEKRHRVSLVISHAGRHIRRKGEELTDECVAEVRRFFPEARDAGIVDTLVVRAPRATFRAAPGQATLRPPTETNLGNLFLAGDWTDTGLPSTIESAVASGKRAVEAVHRKKP